MISVAYASVVQRARAQVQVRRSAPCRSEVVVIGGGVAAEVANVGNVSVRLPCEAMEYNGNSTFFAVDVLPQDGRAPWRVMRRYSHFDALAASMERPQSQQCLGCFAGFTSGRMDCAGVPFPRKCLFGCVGEKLEARRRGLELWLNHVLSLTSNSYLNKFLLAGRFAVPALKPSLPEPSAPPRADMLGDGDELILLQVVIPQGVAAEDLLKVVAPGGGETIIMVPWGLTVGSPLELWFDPVAGTLSVHHRQDWQALREA